MDNVNLNDEQLASVGLRQVPRGKQFGKDLVNYISVLARIATDACFVAQQKTVKSS